MSKLSPKDHTYNKEISKSVQEVGMKYSILLDYTKLEISEVPHWSETFQDLARSNVQPMQEPAPNFSAQPHQVNANLSHQQAEINRLM